MALQKERTYLVMNYNSSPVSITTKNHSYIIEGGSLQEPSVLPLTIEEIITSNSNGCAFKYGYLWFEKEFEKDIYEELRIHNWESLLRDEDIEDIILNPTKEKLEKIISIDNEAYFNRVIGVYTGLKSVFTDISKKVELVIAQRADELSKNKRATNIRLSSTSVAKNDSTNERVEQLEEQNKKLLERLSTMESLLTSLSEQKETVPSDSMDNDKPVKKTPGRKPTK